MRKKDNCLTTVFEITLQRLFYKTRRSPIENIPTVFLGIYFNTLFNSERSCKPIKSFSDQFCLVHTRVNRRLVRNDVVAVFVLPPRINITDQKKILKNVYPPPRAVMETVENVLVNVFVAHARLFSDILKYDLHFSVFFYAHNRVLVPSSVVR